MTKRPDDNLGPIILVPKKEWDALVRFFREEEKIMRDSYGITGKEKDWPTEYQNIHPKHFKIYEAALRAASRKF